MTSAQQAAARRVYGDGASGKAVSGYMEQEVQQWSAEKIILKMYDLFIVAARQRDIAKMNRVLTSLITALDFEYKDQATRLFRMYEYCQGCIMAKRYDEALGIIRDLRETWADAFNLK